MADVTKDKSTAVIYTEEKKLLADLDKYRKIATELGGEDVRIITPADIVQNIRPRLTCIFAHCPSLGTSYFCPPSWEIPWEDQKSILKSYNYILAYRLPYHRENLGCYTGPAASNQLEGYIHLYKRNWPDEKLEYWLDMLKKYTAPMSAARAKNIGRVVELAARKDGHYFAFTGFSGSCSQHKCTKFEAHCTFQTGGQCRFPGEVRPDGAGAMNIDYMRTNARMGWQSWTAGWSALPEYFPEDVETYLYHTAIIYID